MKILKLTNHDKMDDQGLIIHQQLKPYHGQDRPAAYEIF